jgi:hypothetical protein
MERPSPLISVLGGQENVAIKLDWPDLLIDVTDEQFENWIGEWRGLVSGRAAVAFLNNFGVWFLRRPDGPVEMLDVFSGDIERVTESYEAFVRNVNDRPWQEVYLLSKLVYQLHEAGKIPGAGECYAIVPHAAFGGPNPMADEPVRLEQVSVMSMLVWQSICAQSVRGTVEGG